MGIGTAIGAVVGIGGAILGKRTAKKSERDNLRAIRESAAEQAAISTEAINVRDRLKRIQIKQQATVAVARQRTKSQRARIGGVGGSFAQVRAGESEIQEQVDIQVNELEENFALAEKQIAVTLSAAQRGAVSGAAQASSVANVALTQRIGQTFAQAAKSPAIVSAVSDFFKPAGTSPFTTPSNPLGLTPGQGL